jgi:hypothetical protein
LRDDIATDVLHDIPTDALQTTLRALVDIKEHIKGAGDGPADIAVK